MVSIKAWGFGVNHDVNEADKTWNGSKAFEHDQIKQQEVKIAGRL